MATVKDTQEESLENIQDVLTNAQVDFNAKLRATDSLKKLFKPPDKILSNLRLDSLLQEARISLESEKLEKNFLHEYGVSLVDFFGRDATLDAELLYHLERILTKLKKEDESLTDALVTRFWSRLETSSLSQADGILDASKQTIERTVLDWLENPTSLHLEFLSKMSANSPKVFQTLSSILYEILIRTRGHEDVFELTESFITSVRRICQKEEKNFLGLYPKGCGRLVALLMVAPEIYSSENVEIFNEVLSLLLETFSVSKKKALILLSHYPKWVSVFKAHLENIEFTC